MMRLSEIGFYTLTDERIAQGNGHLSRCELVLTARCNFRCPYCRSVGGEDLPYAEAERTVNIWADNNLRNIRFSGGEPTLYNGLAELCSLAKSRGIERIAVSTNGSAHQSIYDRLLHSGVNDFSVSLDACCAEDGDRMAGGVRGSWEKVIKNIRFISPRVYTTVGVVLTEENGNTINDTISLADDLGVSDIRIIPASQNGSFVEGLSISPDVLKKHPILKYRVENLQNDIPLRGLRENDSHRCGLVLDDMAVNQNKHYPCIIYMRESGAAIGNVDETMMEKRNDWYNTHNTHDDIICRKNCLDVCREYNNQYTLFHRAN